MFCFIFLHFFAFFACRVACAVQHFNFSSSDEANNNCCFFGAQLVCAQRELSLIVGSKVGQRYIGKRMHNLITDGIARMLSDMTGGVTRQKGTGYYVSNHDGLVLEDVQIVTTSLIPTRKVMREIFQIASWVRRELSQESVMIKLSNSETFFLTEENESTFQ